MKLATSFTHRPWLSLLGLVLLASTPAACSGSFDKTDGDGAPERLVEVEAATGIATFAQGHLGAAEVAALFHADFSELTVTSEQKDAQGEVHTRYAQFKNGLEVLGGELIVHRRGAAVYSVNGSARADLAAPAAPSISSAQAIAAALAGRLELTAEPRTSLAYRHTAADDALVLVYKVTVTGTATDGLPIVDTVLVNATDGSIVDTIPTIHTAKYREVHDCSGGQRLPCPLARAEGQPPVADAVVNGNYGVLGSVYDTYKDLFGRDSIDGNGSKLLSAVHYHSASYFLAFWNGSQIVYGNDVGTSSPALSLDLTGHEMTHGVITRTSNLTYSGQPGALNESLADIFGAVIEWYGRGKVIQSGTWQFAEDIYTPDTPGDAIRYLDDPKKDGSSLDYYPDYNANVDIHYASGISNLAFYLLSQGGKHPRGKTTTTVDGIGIEKAARVFYRANTVYFTSNTTFGQAKALTGRAATDLGYTPAEIASVKAAWTAVGVP